MTPPPLPRNRANHQGLVPTPPPPSSALQTRPPPTHDAVALGGCITATMGTARTPYVELRTPAGEGVEGGSPEAAAPHGLPRHVPQLTLPATLRDIYVTFKARLDVNLPYRFTFVRSAADNDAVVPSSEVPAELHEQKDDEPARLLGRMSVDLSLLSPVVCLDRLCTWTSDKEVYDLCSPFGEVCAVLDTGGRGIRRGEIGFSTPRGGGSIEPPQNWGAGVREKDSIDGTINQFF